MSKDTNQTRCIQDKQGDGAVPCQAWDPTYTADTDPTRQARDLFRRDLPVFAPEKIVVELNIISQRSPPYPRNRTQDGLKTREWMNMNT